MDDRKETLFSIYDNTNSLVAIIHRENDTATVDYEVVHHMKNNKDGTYTFYCKPKEYYKKCGQDSERYKELLITDKDELLYVGSQGIMGIYSEEDWTYAEEAIFCLSLLEKEYNI